MFFERVKTKGLGHNAYLLGCGEGTAVLVDPRRDVAEYLKLARSNNLSITHVLETHRQEDFEFGSRAIADLTGAKIVTGRHQLFGRSDVQLDDGEELKVGTTRFVALETPGHTPESMSYAVYVKDAGDKCWGVFTGDSLFVGDTGRTDLTDEEKTAEFAGQLYDSVHEKIAPLGDQTLVLPAHGSGSACGGNISERDDTTLGIEKGTNSVFKKSRMEFVDQKKTEKLPRPPYFKHMEVVNLEGGRPLVSPSPPRLLQPKELREKVKQGGVLIDTRTPDAFAAAHIHGAYNIWLDGLSTFGGWVARDGTPIYLIVDKVDDAQAAVEALARVGIDSVEGVMVKGVESWRESGFPIEEFDTTSAQETAVARDANEDFRILDVRDDMEREEEHIPGSMHTYVGYLEDHLPAVPKSTRIVVHCSVGHRSGVAASILERNGYTAVSNMLGGLTAWKKLNLPIEKKEQS